MSELTIEVLRLVAVVVIAAILAEAFFRFVWLPGYEEDKRQREYTTRAKTKSMMHDPTMLDAYYGEDGEWDEYVKKKGWK